MGLPALDEPYDLDPSTIASLREKGHCFVRGLASAEECAAYLPEIQAGVERWHPDPTPMEDRDTYGKAFLQAMALRRIHEPVRGFVDSPRFARVAAELLGVDGVRLFHDQALFKEAGGGHTPWHQDQNYWPLDTTDTITMWMPLVDIEANAGTMTFLDGSHVDGDVGAGHIGDASDLAIQVAVDYDSRPTTTYGALRAGDATFHKGWTVHNATANESGRVRPVMTIIYFADGARVTEPTSREQAFDRGAWLDNIEPGELANGPSSPLLWPPVLRGRRS